MNIEIRTAIPADIPALLNLYEQLALDNAFRTAPEDRARAALDEIANQSGRALLVALDDGRIVGTADLLLISPNLTHEGRPWALVEHVVVDRSSRRQGVGRQLMEEALRRARKAGCHRLQLFSDQRRSEAHAFYEALGFEAGSQGFRRRLP